MRDAATPDPPRVTLDFVEGLTPGEVARIGAHMAEGLVLQPGDTLLIRVAPTVSREHVNRLKAELDARLPGVETVVIGAEQIAVVRRLADPPLTDRPDFRLRRQPPEGADRG